MSGSSVPSSARMPSDPRPAGGEPAVGGPAPAVIEASPSGGAAPSGSAASERRTGGAGAGASTATAGRAPAALVIATPNSGKLAKFRELLAPFGLAARGLAEVPGLGEVEETGDSFVANALLKARAAVTACGLPALADDSGLEVEALGGEPGIRSARWAGPVGAAERNARLLARLAAVPEERRAARFVCVLALCLPDGASALARGEVAGRITDAPRGAGGFGYDPLFLLPDLGRTFAELSAVEKNARSHRARAWAALLPALRWLLAGEAS